MWSIMDVLPPAALRQASCRNGSGGRGAETIYSNNGPRVIREAIDLAACVPRFSPPFPTHPFPIPSTLAILP